MSSMQYYPTAMSPAPGLNGAVPAAQQLASTPPDRDSGNATNVKAAVRECHIRLDHIDRSHKTSVREAKDKAQQLDEQIDGHRKHTTALFDDLSVRVRRLDDPQSMLQRNLTDCMQRISEIEQASKAAGTEVRLESISQTLGDLRTSLAAFESPNVQEARLAVLNSNVEDSRNRLNALEQSSLAAALDERFQSLIISLADIKDSVARAMTAAEAREAFTKTSERHDDLQTRLTKAEEDIEANALDLRQANEYIRADVVKLQADMDRSIGGDMTLSQQELQVKELKLRLERTAQDDYVNRLEDRVRALEQAAADEKSNEAAQVPGQDLETMMDQQRSLLAEMQVLRDQLVTSQRENEAKAREATVAASIQSACGTIAQAFQASKSSLADDITRLQQRLTERPLSDLERRLMGELFAQLFAVAGHTGTGAGQAGGDRHTPQVEKQSLNDGEQRASRNIQSDRGSTATQQHTPTPHGGTPARRQHSPVLQDQTNPERQHTLASQQDLPAERQHTPVRQQDTQTRQQHTPASEGSLRRRGNIPTASSHRESTRANKGRKEHPDDMVMWSDPRVARKKRRRVH